jgi:hypothetical protein
MLGKCRTQLLVEIVIIRLKRVRNVIPSRNCSAGDDVRWSIPQSFAGAAIQLVARSVGPMLPKAGTAAEANNTENESKLYSHDRSPNNRVQMIPTRLVFAQEQEQ